jgi:hypothetical protein
MPIASRPFLLPARRPASPPPCRAQIKAELARAVEANDRDLAWTCAAALDGSVGALEILTRRFAAAIHEPRE